MKYYYKSVEENEDYIIIGKRKDIYNMKIELYNDSEIGEEIKIMYYTFSDYEANNGYTDGIFTIKRKSPIGTYIINHPEIFIDEDKNVSYEKVKNAYLIAVYENNVKMSNKIYPLFRGRINGMKDDLSADYSEMTINYILNNSDFDEHIREEDNMKKKKNKQNDNNEYIIYEDYMFKIEKLKPKSKVQVLKLDTV